MGPSYVDLIDLGSHPPYLETYAIREADPGASRGVFALLPQLMLILGMISKSGKRGEN